MHHVVAASAALAAGLAMPGFVLPAAATPSDHDLAFVAEFERACVPGRLHYADSLAAAEAAGWLEVGPDAHPELDAMMQIAAAAETLTAPELADPTFDVGLYGKDIDGRPHFLVVSRVSFVIGEPDDPLNPWAYVGCHLYDFDATVPVDPVAVSRLIGRPAANSSTGDGMVGYIWGPPCPLPRTGDTYLTFIPDGHPLVAETGFSGQVLKFDTSELDPGQPEPAPYC